MLRKKIGKNKSLQFKEGWLEFTNFKDAKEAAEQMNSQQVEVKRTRRAAGEMWNCRCLPRGYRWEDLVTEMEGEKRLRRMKMQAELQREREINEAYRQLAMKELARRKGGDIGTGGGSNNNSDDKDNATSGKGGEGVERDENILVVGDFVKEANSIPAQLMKFQRQRRQAAKKANKEREEQKSAKASGIDEKKSSVASVGAHKKKNSVVSVAPSNRIAKVYTSEGYRDLYSS